MNPSPTACELDQALSDDARKPEVVGIDVDERENPVMQPFDLEDFGHDLPRDHRAPSCDQGYLPHRSDSLSSHRLSSRGASA